MIDNGLYQIPFFRMRREKWVIGTAERIEIALSRSIVKYFKYHVFNLL